MLDVSFFNVRQHRQFQHAGGSLLLARCESADESWMTVDAERAKSASAVLSITPEADGVSLRMLGCKSECYCGRTCEFPGDCHWTLPARFNIGDTRFEVNDRGRNAGSQRPLEILGGERRQRESRRGEGGGPSPITLSRWFYSLGMLNHWGRSAQEFFVQAARCAVESIGLDGAIVLRRRDDGWEIVASHLPMPELGIHCDWKLLDQLLVSPRTMFHGAAHAPKIVEPTIDRATRLVEQLVVLDVPVERTISLNDDLVDADDTDVVMSPLCNAERELTGAIYGFRSVRPGNSRRGIRYLEAHLVELLANAVTEGIVRLEHEAEVERRQALMQHANLASSGQDAELHVAEQREITMLFVDLRNSSGLANSLGITQTYELMGDVMDVLAAAVMDLDGVIIDYYGDGLAAMWNAPADQPEHPELACRAALRMIDALPAVQSKWSHVLVDELRLGVGVHTGLAQVGNAGSNRRAKYGPRGANVHLASRVEAAAKAVGVSAVVTRATASRLSNRLLATRICRVQLPGVESAVDLFGIRRPTTDEAIADQLADYGRALEFFESGEFERAAETLKNVTSAAGNIPLEFLREKIGKAIDLSKHRRRTDEASTGPVIALNVK